MVVTVQKKTMAKPCARRRVAFPPLLKNRPLDFVAFATVVVINWVSLQAVQQGKLGEGVEIEVHELASEDSGELHEAPEGDAKDWRSVTWIRGKEYSWVHKAVKKKKTVMHLAAAKLLEELLPGK